MSIYLETIRRLQKKSWQWLKDQIVRDVPETDGLCEYDCRKQQCSEGEWATCERRIQKAAGELWPRPSLARPSEMSPRAKWSQGAVQAVETERMDYRANPASGTDQRQELARAVLAELRRRYRVDCRSRDGSAEVADPELVEAVREEIERFLRKRSQSSGDDDPRPSAA